MPPATAVPASATAAMPATVPACIPIAMPAATPPSPAQTEPWTRPAIVARVAVIRIVRRIIAGVVICGRRGLHIGGCGLDDRRGVIGHSWGRGWSLHLWRGL